MLPQQQYRMKKELQQVEKQNHWRMAAGMAEFFGVVLGVVCILILLALLFSLLNWLRQDINSTFAIIKTHFQ